MRVTSIYKNWYNQIISKFAFQSLNESTFEERSKARFNRVYLSVIASAGARVIFFISSLVTIRMTVSYLGTERYGLWMTISSFTAMLSFADFGLGNGLLNMISEANGKDDRQASRKYVSSALFLLLAISAVAMMIFISVYSFIPWTRIFNINTPLAISEVGSTMLVFFSCMILMVPIGAVGSIRLGYQEGYINSIWDSLGKILGLIGVFAVVYLKGGLPWLVLAVSGTPIIAYLVNGYFLFKRNRPWLQPTINQYSWSSAKRIIRVGLMFFLLQTSAAVAYSTDNIVIAQVLGPEAVAQYSVTYRLFLIVQSVIGIMFTPLWPAFGEAISRGDLPWVRKTLAKSLRLSILITTISVIPLVIFGTQIVSIWVGPQIRPTSLLLIGFGLWTVIGGLGNVIAMYLNGSGIIKLQAILALFMAISSLALKIYLARVIGLPGVIWGTTIAYLVIELIPLFIYLPWTLKKVDYRYEM